MCTNFCKSEAYYLLKTIAFTTYFQPSGRFRGRLAKPRRIAPLPRRAPDGEFATTSSHPVGTEIFRNRRMHFTLTKMTFSVNEEMFGIRIDNEKQFFQHNDTMMPI